MSVIDDDVFTTDVMHKSADIIASISTLDKTYYI